VEAVSHKSHWSYKSYWSNRTTQLPLTSMLLIKKHKNLRGRGR